MRSFILGTDWWTDCDDAVAIRLLTKYHKEKRINLLGIAINACMEHSVAALKGFLRADGVDIAVGIDRAATDFGGAPSYQKRLAADYGADLTNADAEDAVRLYRRILAEASEPIEIMEIGFLQVVSALFRSGGDDISEKSGIELVREKVKRFWVMAGKWDKDGEAEHNFCLNHRSRVGGKEFLDLCPVPITFLGFEVGYGVITGGELDENDHLYRVLCDHGSKGGRHSWDPMLATLAVIGDAEAAGYSLVHGRASIDATNGKNYFVRADDGIHSFVVKQKPNSFYEAVINERL